MRQFARPSLGLLSRILAILLLTVIIEFGVSTLLYERASQFSVRDDEARRLAEHLVISRRLIAERPVAERLAMAAQLTTDRYLMRWEGRVTSPPPLATELAGMRRQIIAWEPALASADLRLQLTSPGRRSVVSGGLRLPDDSWVYFRTRTPIVGLNLTTERILQALAPAVALIVMGGLLMQRTLQPLRRLAAAAEQMGSGTSVHVEEEGPTDVVRVVRAFNTMQDRIHQLINDRTQGLFAVGHDMRTPLSRLKLRADAIPDTQVRHAIRGDIHEMEAMVGSLLAYLGGDDDPENPAHIDLAVTCATIADDAADNGATVIYNGPDHLEMVLRRSAIKRAITNLVDNSLHYGTRATLSIMVDDFWVYLNIDDDGPGIPADKTDLVIQPFVRLDPARQRDTKGFGLGLAIVADTVAREGGRLSLSNRPEGGLRAQIMLPRR
ncbi:ATP-binding protein [Sphingomonas sp. 28-62-11]|uniref:ATP-binding protein n=1 Tax=Sphingomonas sp. 28-62-11 TaxID=1970432 RepID=UPI000BD2661F|nr:MAG: two-component sensor histidine kinase [Sphingomonas sp. 28-62-11]